MIAAIEQEATDLARQLWDDRAAKITIQDLAEDYCDTKLRGAGFNPRLFIVRVVWADNSNLGMRRIPPEVTIEPKDAVTLLGEVE